MDNTIISNEKEFKRFAEAMRFAADEGKLPVMLEHSDPLSVNMKELEEFSVKFKNETGLDIDYHLYTCNCCDKLHLNILIDFVDDDEYDDDTYSEGLHILQ